MQGAKRATETEQRVTNS